MTYFLIVQLMKNLKCFFGSVSKNMFTFDINLIDGVMISVKQ